VRTTLPQLSVVLPVWNGARYLDAAIDSVLGQDHPSFELIIVDDGSTDHSTAIARSAASRDHRVSLLSLPHVGLSTALNAGLDAARGKYVARMDADDIALQGRLRKQCAFLDEHPEHVAVGSAIHVVDDRDRNLGVYTFPRGAALDHALLHGHPVCHPTVTVRREVLVTAGGYRQPFYPAEDLDLWVRLRAVGPLANMGEPLLRYRMHPDSVSIREHRWQAEQTHRIRAPYRRRRRLSARSGVASAQSQQAQYHRVCARVALKNGVRRPAAVHASAGLLIAPMHLQWYLLLVGCAIPSPLHRRLARLRARYRQRRTAGWSPWLPEPALATTLNSRS
jgi:glycosyltransferase involved in cell wall biosynthesis